MRAPHAGLSARSPATSGCGSSSAARWWSTPTTPSTSGRTRTTRSTTSRWPTSPTASSARHGHQRSPSRGTARHFTVQAATGRRSTPPGRYADSPIEELRDRVRFELDAMDAWFEEDEEIFVHPRSPYARIQILPSSRHVTVERRRGRRGRDDRPTFLYETGLPRADVRPQARRPHGPAHAHRHHLTCPYKGTARYWTSEHAERRARRPRVELPAHRSASRRRSPGWSRSSTSRSTSPSTASPSHDRLRLVRSGNCESPASKSPRPRDLHHATDG